MKMKKPKSNKTQTGFSSVTTRDTFDSAVKITPHTFPIYTSSTYVYESAEKADKVFIVVI